MIDFYENSYTPSYLWDGDNISGILFKVLTYVVLTDTCETYLTLTHKMFNPYQMLSQDYYWKFKCRRNSLLSQYVVTFKVK